MPLTDLIVAKPSDIKAIGKSQAPLKKFPGIDIKGIDPVKMATLQGHLTGAAFDDLLPAYEPAFAASDEGPWVIPLPAAFTKSLATLEGPARAAVADQWATAEEFALDGWKPTDVAAVLAEICGLAKRCESEERALFLWMSL